LWKERVRLSIRASHGTVGALRRHSVGSTRPFFLDAINAEKEALLAKGVFEEVVESEVPSGCKTLPIFRIERDIKGNIEKYKCRPVAKGYHQVPGRKYDEVCHVTMIYLIYQSTLTWRRLVIEDIPCIDHAV
jgi:hypothetical protein